MSIPSLFLTQHERAQPLFVQLLTLDRVAPGELQRVRKPHRPAQLRSPVYLHFILKRSQESLS